MNFLADENLSRRFVNALRRRNAKIDIVRVPEVGLVGKDDAAVLDWASEHNRILITKDRATIPPLVSERLATQTATPPILIIRPNAHLPSVLAMIEGLIQHTAPFSWSYPIRWIP